MEILLTIYEIIKKTKYFKNQFHFKTVYMYMFFFIQEE